MANGFSRCFLTNTVSNALTIQLYQQSYLKLLLVHAIEKWSNIDQPYPIVVFFTYDLDNFHSLASTPRINHRHMMLGIFLTIHENPENTWKTALTAIFTVTAIWVHRSQKLVSVSLIDLYHFKIRSKFVSLDRGIIRIQTCNLLQWCQELLYCTTSIVNLKQLIFVLSLERCKF